MTKLPFLYQLKTSENQFRRCIDHSSHQRCSVRKMLLKFSQNSQENNCARVSFSIKLQAYARATLLKKRLWRRCFPVNFGKFLRTPISTEQFWWLLLYRNGILAWNVLTLSCWRFLSCRNQSIDLLCKSMHWFLYGRDRCCERVKDTQMSSLLWLYVIILSRTNFRVNPHSIVCLNVNELFARSRGHIWSLSDSNGIRTHSHLVCKRTLNYLAKLAKWLSCVVSNYL